MAAFSAETRSLANQYRTAGDAGAMQFIPALEKSAASAAAAKAQVAALNATMIKTGIAANGFRESLSFGSNMSLRLREYTSLFSKLGEAIAASFAAKMAVGAIENVAKIGDALEKTSKITGISVETLSGWHYGADQMGVSAESLDMALVRLGKNVQMALTTPTSIAAKTFLAMGMNQQFLAANSNNLEAILLKTADALRGNGEGGVAAAYAQNVLSRSGAQLLPWLLQGSDGIEKLNDRLRELGGEMSGPMAAAMHEHIQAVKDLGAAWEGLMLKLTPVIQGLTNFFQVIANGLSGNWNKAAVTDYTYSLHQLEDQLAEVKLDAAQSNGLDKWWDDRKIKGLELQIDIVKGKLDKLRAPSQGGDLAAFGGSNPIGAPKAPSPALGSSPLPNLDSSTGGASALEKFHEQLAEMQADWTGTHTAMLAETVKMWQAETGAAGLSEKERVEVAKSLAEARRALNQAVATESATIARQDADTDLQISKMKLSATKNTLDEELAARKINAAQWLTAMQAEVAEEYALDKQRLDNELASLTPLTAAYDRVYNQIRMLKAKNVADLAALDKQGTANTIREATAHARQWEQAFKPINSAFDTMIRGMMTGRQTLGTSLRAAAQQWVTQEIESDAQVLLHKLAIYAAETAGVITGEAAKQAAQETTNTMSLAGLAAKALKAIFSGAAETFAGIFGFMAPQIGPYAAVPAAAGMAAVMGVAGMVSAEGGMWTVPGNTLAMLHPEESVWPAGPAAAARDFFANGGQNGAQGAQQGVNVTFAPQIAALDGKSVIALLNSPAIMRQLTKNIAAYMGANPSTRGSY